MAEERVDRERLEAFRTGLGLALRRTRASFEYEAEALDEPSRCAEDHRRRGGGPPEDPAGDNDNRPPVRTLETTAAVKRTG